MCHQGLVQLTCQEKAILVFFSDACFIPVVSMSIVKMEFVILRMKTMVLKKFKY